MSVKKTAKSVEKNGAGDAKIALGMRNYKLMIIGFVAIVLGFMMMIGGGSETPATEFNYEMFSFRRITLSVIVALGGFAFVVYAIMSKGKQDKSKEE